MHARVGVSRYLCPVLRLDRLGVTLSATALRAGTNTRLELQVGDGVTFSLRTVAGPVSRNHTQRFRACDPELLHVARVIVGTDAKRCG